MLPAKSMQVTSSLVLNFWGIWNFLRNVQPWFAGLPTVKPGFPAHSEACLKQWRSRLPGRLGHVERIWQRLLLVKDGALWEVFHGIFMARSSFHPKTLRSSAFQRRNSMERLASLNMDPDSEEAKQHRARVIEGFLTRHGFQDVTKPRDNSLYSRVQMDEISPIEVAKELGDKGLVNDLRKAGAQRPKSSAGGTSWHLQMLRRISGGSRSTTSSSNSESETSSPMKSCLARSKYQDFAEMTYTEWIWDGHSVQSVTAMPERERERVYRDWCSSSKVGAAFEFESVNSRGNLLNKHVPQKPFLASEFASHFGHHSKSGFFLSAPKADMGFAGFFGGRCEWHFREDWMRKRMKKDFKQHLNTEDLASCDFSG